MTSAKLTILNSMAGRDFERALDGHLEWGLEMVDLKDAIFGKGVLGLTDEEAGRAAGLISERGLSVHCLSTGLFFADVEAGEAAFKSHLEKVGRAVEIGRILQPRMIRLLAARTSRRTEVEDSIEHIRSNHPWLVPMYAEAVDRLHEAGFRPTIENEVNNCIFSTPQEIIDFFAALDRYGKACFTWDVQNLWQMGTLPTIDVYEELKGLIGYLHLKGGRKDESGDELRWKSSLEDASWPVVETVRRAVADGVSPVICLNPSHGELKDGYDYDDIVKRDIEFLRRELPGVE